jgi:hypothetical protein
VKGAGAASGSGSTTTTTTTTSTSTTTSTTADLIDTVQTTASRKDLSAFLEKPAKAAEADTKNGRPKAIIIYRALVVARGPGSPEARKLADLLRLTGQNEDAKDVLKEYVANATDPSAIVDAQNALATLTGNDPFATRLKFPSQDKLAKQAFKNGRAAFKKKKYGDALIDYAMGFKLSPDLPGFLRELGATYDKLGASAQKDDYYLRYLRQRPFGKNSDEIRKALTASVLGTMSMTTSLPCDEVWIAPAGADGVPVPGKLPKKDMKMAPGDYDGACYSPKYGAFIKGHATVAAGATVSMDFKWAIVSNKLANPLGRIVIENALDTTGKTMIDLGVDKSDFGVPVPDDGHALHVIAKTDDNSKTEDKYVKLEPGKTTTITW